MLFGCADIGLIASFALMMYNCSHVIHLLNKVGHTRHDPSLDEQRVEEREGAYTFGFTV